MPIGRTPGHLSRAISLQLTRGSRHVGSQCSRANHRVTLAIELQRLRLAFPPDFEHMSLFHVSQSIPVGPAPPFMDLAAVSTATASKQGQRMKEENAFVAENEREVTS